MKGRRSYRMDFSLNINITAHRDSSKVGKQTYMLFS